MEQNILRKVRCGVFATEESVRNDLGGTLPEPPLDSMDSSKCRHIGGLRLVRTISSLDGR